jgi:hypothetical protein
VGYWSGGTEEWNDGVMDRKNKNRDYQRLRVWEDAVALDVETCQRFRSMPFEMKRIAGVQTVGIDYYPRAEVREGRS